MLDQADEGSLPEEVGPRVVQLVVRGCKATGRELGQLLIVSSAKLRALDASCNRLGDETGEGMEELAKCGCLTDLEELDLSGNVLTDVCVVPLSRLPQPMTLLRRLSLSSNNLTVDGARLLAAALKRCVALTELSVAKNRRLGDAGAALLCHHFRENLAIVALDFGCCGLTAECASAFAGLLEETSVLQALDLHGNNLSVRGAQALAKGLAANASLTWLNVADNSFTGSGAELALSASSASDGVGVLADALTKTSSLLMVNVSGNSVTKHAMGTLSKCLASNRSLCRLILSEGDCAHMLAPKHLPNSLVSMSEEGRDEHLPPSLQKRLRENGAAIGAFDGFVQAGDQVRVFKNIFFPLFSCSPSDSCVGAADVWREPGACGCRGQHGAAHGGAQGSWRKSCGCDSAECVWIAVVAQPPRHHAAGAGV